MLLFIIDGPLAFGLGPFCVILIIIDEPLSLMVILVLGGEGHWPWSLWLLWCLLGARTSNFRFCSSALEPLILIVFFYSSLSSP